MSSETKEIEKVEAKQVIVNLAMRCPVCGSWWHYEYRDTLSKYSDIKGAFVGEYKGVKCWRLDTSNFGSGNLCGKHKAKRKAVVTHKGKGVKAWSDEEERAMWGRSRNKEEYSAIIQIMKDEDRTLRDDQDAECRSIIGVNATITKERCEMLKLAEWAKGLEQ